MKAEYDNRDFRTTEFHGVREDEEVQALNRLTVDPVDLFLNACENMGDQPSRLDLLAEIFATALEETKDETSDFTRATWAMAYDMGIASAVRKQIRHLRKYS